MGGLLSGVGKALVGAAEGYGTYLGQKAQIQVKREEDDILERRERALMALKEQASERMADSNLGRQIELDTAQTRNKVAGEIAVLGPKSQAQRQIEEEKDLRQAEREQAKDLREFTIWLKKFPLEQQAQLTLEDFRQDRQDQRTERGLAENVVARGIDANGDVVVAKNNDTRTTFHGMKPNPVALDPATELQNRLRQSTTEPRSPRGGSGLPVVKSAEDYQKLPSGALYVDPDGNRRTKP